VVDTVLSVASRAVLDACARVGADVEAVLREARVARETVLDPDARLSASAADAIWAAAYARVGDPHLALHAAEQLPFGVYKVVDFLAANSATVGEAMTRIAAYFAIVDPRGVLEIVGEGPVELRMRARDPGVDLVGAAQEYTFAALVTRGRVCAGEAWAPSAVRFTFERPADDSEHRRILRAPLSYGAERAALVFDTEAWCAPVLGASPWLLEVLEESARRLLAELPSEPGFLGRVRSAISDELSRGEPSLARISKRLATSERTLQRRLREEGTTLAALHAEVRSATARAHLTDPALSLAEIAFLLGFADQSAFSRAFRRWTGESPGAWRARRRRSA
jgi:AraC-like DNA-binding protein